MGKQRHSIFRPCIDLHEGQVKQIVGGTLSENDPSTLKTNFVASESPGDFARLYRRHNLRGGHLIKLGPGNDDAAKDALAAWPGKLSAQKREGGLQIGGGINIDNARSWLDSGASKVIVTSFLFPGMKFSLDRLCELSRHVGKDRLVVDVSCRRRNNEWIVAMNKWQDMTDLSVTKETLDMLSQYCSEFLVHAADVEGLCQGIDEELVTKLGQWATIPTTYAGGAKDIADLDLVDRLSRGKVDLTYGSSLDIFGGNLVRFEQLVKRSKEDQE
ncbi:Phosphoribosylformimino-5-aminoimidazole carboxamide ribotide isomerase [Vararia minispora EC-137]|uniref:Phosphoribosylformimino-5-aminoimidazole carboxamide ribotide isomerase n=1 Tax=Vararia minispora EC-137 TaxID=1314806 RepID=A0ACB8QZE5_9AGAM|nr:Phosphoribosylformimino-5-aminoimidazole carboxamide ribotide isomerase [Vararia minispora EC-137]